MPQDRRQNNRRCSAIVSIFLIAVLAVGLYYWARSVHVPKRVILEADFEQGMVEYVPDDGFVRFVFAKKPRVRDVVEAIEKAASDDRVKGLVARVGQSNMRLAQVQELRDAVIAFRAAGKYAVAYAETFGEAGPGNSSYYLATAFDTIYLQPSGDVGLTGLIYEQFFVRGTLDKLGIIPRLDGRKQYKSYRYLFTERKYVLPHREEVTHVMNSQFSQLVRGIAEGRRLSEGQVRTLIDQGLFVGQEALDARLVDGLAYRSEVYDKVKDKSGGKPDLLSLTDYRRRAGGPNDRGTTVALIYGVGGIARGKSGYNPVTGEFVMGSDTITDAIRKAVDDKEVKAILFRIDSPGGSYVASDTIWRETVNARKAGKPVIVSMGSTAGSGGYFVALAGDKIVAQPATITGSIGVLGGKLVTTGFWQKLGVTWDEVHTSKNADAWTGTKDLNPEQRARFEDWLDRVYEDFTSKVAQGRNLTKDTVEKIAKGRIWTGEDAKQLGLVDELGGFPAALRLVRTALKLPETAPVRLKVYPERKGLAKFLEELKGVTSEAEDADVLTQTLEEIQPIVRAVHSLRVSTRSEVLRMPELEICGM